MIDTVKAFKEALAILKDAETIAFDFETMPNGKYPNVEKKDASLHHKMLDIEGLSLKSENLPATYIRFKDSPISRVVLFDGISELFKQDSLFVAHNIAFDAKIADYFFHARPKHKYCTMVGYWYVNENVRKSKVALGKEIFGLDLIDYATAKGMTEDDFVAYAERDAEFAWNLFHYIKEKLPKKLWELSSTLEMDFVDVLIDMCLYGTHIDMNNLKEGERILTDKALELEAQIHKEFGEFNIDSPQQLCEKIYGIKITRKKGQPVKLEKVEGWSKDKYAPVAKWNNDKDPNKRTPSTDAKALAFIDTPAAILVKEYRKVTKLLDTYALGYQKWVIDGVIYPAFNHVGTVTGRLSSDKPNMQNLPREASYGWWIRDGIYAPDGYDLVVADESQLEIRILAHFCRDTQLIKAILTGEDVHLATAKIIYQKDDISKTERTFAKTMNFAIIYGQGIPAIAATLKIDIKEAIDFRKRYFRTFPAIQDYIDECVNVMKTKGYVKTLLGRRRRIPEIYSKDSGIYGHAVRQTVNSIIQGSASDVLKVAMVRISEELKEKELDAHILLQVHDELVIQSKKDISEEVCEITKRWMEHPFKDDLIVPLVVEPKICHIWSEGKD